MKLGRFHKIRIFWFLMTIILCLEFMLIQVNYSIAQFYFPVTSGASTFYNYGTLRYGNLYGLSATTPFGMGMGFYGIFHGFWGRNNLGLLWPFGGFYGVINPLGPYTWAYF